MLDDTALIALLLVKPAGRGTPATPHYVLAAPSNAGTKTTAAIVLALARIWVPVLIAAEMHHGVVGAVAALLLDKMLSHHSC